MKKNKKIIIIGAVVGIGGYLLYKWLQLKKLTSINIPSPYVPPPVTPTPTPTPSSNDLPQSTINSISNNIFGWMDGYGTKEEEILSGFSMLKTNNDFDNLKLTFGVKTISSGTGNIFQSDFTGNLSECLRNELSDYWITEINKILASHNIQRSI